MQKPFRSLSQKEWILWAGSLIAVITCNFASGSVDPLTMTAMLIGVTDLMLSAKGSVWAQMLEIIYSALYALISWRFHYWGEMITYLGMTMPMAIWSAITWFRHPSQSNKAEVAIQKLSRRQVKWMITGCIMITALFHFVLKRLRTPNLFFSTISVTASFLAASLTMLRSSYYALGYAMNDLILIILWMYAALQNPAYIPVVINFVIFLINNLYGFVCWRKREFRMSRTPAEVNQCREHPGKTVYGQDGAN